MKTKIRVTVEITFEGHAVDQNDIRALLQATLEDLRQNGSLSVDSWYDSEATAETSCDSVTVALASV